MLRAPNDILGVEYCKALLRQHSALVPLALPRRGAAHDAPLDAAPGRYASASALRALVRAGGAAALAPHVPPACLRLYMQAEAEGDILDGRAFGIAVLSRLRAMDAAGLRAVRGAAEGLENRLAAAVQGAGTLDELVQAMRTKRYATARLRRLVLDAALGYTGDLPALPPICMCWEQMKRPCGTALRTSGGSAAVVSFAGGSGGPKRPGCARGSGPMPRPRT